MEKNNLIVDIIKLILNYCASVGFFVFLLFVMFYLSGGNHG